MTERFVVVQGNNINHFISILLGSHVTAHCGGGIHRVQYDESLHQHLRGNSERNILISIFC